MIRTSLLGSEVPSSDQKTRIRPSVRTAIQIQAFDLIQRNINFIRIFDAKGDLGHFLLTETLKLGRILIREVDGFHSNLRSFL